MPIAVHARRYAFLISIFYTFFIIVRNNWMYRAKLKKHMTAYMPIVAETNLTIQVHIVMQCLI